MKALVNRYYDQQIKMFEHIFVEDMKYLPPEIMIDRLLDPILKLHCGYPAFIHIMLGSDVSTDIAAASCELDEEITYRLANFLKMLSPHLQDEQAHLTAVVTKSIFKSSVSMLASSQDETFQNQVVAEIKKMLLAYLTPILEPQK
jgi:AcrR family transcriptional regulator